MVVLTALERLPAEQQEVLRMVYFCDRTQGEVALRLQVPLSQAKARVFAGLRRVVHLLDLRTPHMTDSPHEHQLIVDDLPGLLSGELAPGREREVASPLDDRDACRREFATVAKAAQG